MGNVDMCGYCVVFLCQVGLVEYGCIFVFQVVGYVQQCIDGYYVGIVDVGDQDVLGLFQVVVESWCWQVVQQCGGIVFVVFVWLVVVYGDEVWVEVVYVGIVFVVVGLVDFVFVFEFGFFWQY